MDVGDAVAVGVQGDGGLQILEVADAVTVGVLARLGEGVVVDGRGDAVDGLGEPRHGDRHRELGRNLSGLATAAEGERDGQNGQKARDEQFVGTHDRFSKCRVRRGGITCCTVAASRLCAQGAVASATGDASCPWPGWPYSSTELQMLEHDYRVIIKTTKQAYSSILLPFSSSKQNLWTSDVSA